MEASDDVVHIDVRFFNSSTLQVQVATLPIRFQRTLSTNDISDRNLGCILVLGGHLHEAGWK